MTGGLKCLLDKILRTPPPILILYVNCWEWSTFTARLALTPVLQNPEEEDRLVEQVNDQELQDEGFEEEILEDITVPVLYEDEDRPSSLPLPQSPELSTSSGGEGQHLAPSVLSQPSDTGGSLSDEVQVRQFKGFV